MRIPSDHSSRRIRSLKANKRDYSVDKLDDRSAHHSGNESVLANERVRAVPLLLSAFTSAYRRRTGVLFRNTSHPGSLQSLRKITRIALSARRENGDKKLLLRALTYMHTFFPLPLRMRWLRLRLCSAYFSELTRCPRSFINPPRLWSELFRLPAFPFILLSALCPLCFLQSRFSSVKNCSKNAVGSGA